MPLTIEWTRPAQAIPESVRSELASRLDRLHPFFPEMKTKMKIGITRRFDGLAFQSDSGLVKLMLELRKTRKGVWKFPTYWTLAHEFMHLAQFNSHGIPAGERACDIHALARVPPEYIDESPTFLVVPRGLRTRWMTGDATMAHELAIEALTQRKRGLRCYASWWESEFERRMAERRRREARV